MQLQVFGTTLTFTGGTASTPQPPHGAQRQMRHAASAPPFRAPCARMASMAYWEQFGSKRQRPGGPDNAASTGEKRH